MFGCRWNWNSTQTICSDSDQESNCLLVYVFDSFKWKQCKHLTNEQMIFLRFDFHMRSFASWHFHFISFDAEQHTQKYAYNRNDKYRVLHVMYAYTSIINMFIHMPIDNTSKTFVYKTKTKRKAMIYNTKDQTFWKSVLNRPLNRKHLNSTTPLKYTK